MIGRDGTIRHCSSSTGCLAELTESGEETVSPRAVWAG